MKINKFQNAIVEKNNVLSNKIAKNGALVGLATSSAYLAKNFDDIFAKNIRNVNKMTVEYVAAKFPNSAKEMGADKLLADIVKKTKIRTVAIPLAATAVVTAGAALIGKTIGVIAEKIQAKKLDKAIEQIRQDIQSNQSSVDATNEEERIGKMIDELAEKSIKDLETPIDFEAIDAQILPQEKIDEFAANQTFKGASSEFKMPFYTDSAPDLATINFIEEFGTHTVAPVSPQKSICSGEEIRQASKHNIPIYTDVSGVEMGTIGFNELEKYNNHIAYN